MFNIVIEDQFGYETQRVVDGRKNAVIMAGNAIVSGYPEVWVSDITTGEDVLYYGYNGYAVRPDMSFTYEAMQYIEQL